MLYSFVMVIIYKNLAYNLHWGLCLERSIKHCRSGQIDDFLIVKYLSVFYVLI